MKHFRSTALKTVILFFCASALSARAQWNENAGVGPFTYTDPANWVGGAINNVFSTPPQSGAILQFPSDFTLTNGLLVNFPGNSNLIFQSDSGTLRTLRLSLGNWLRTNNNGGTITIGTPTNPLAIDLNGATRTIGGGAALSTSAALICTNLVYAQIVDSSGGTNGLTCGGGNVSVQLLNNNNSFIGPVSFLGVRGGGFSSIKSIGGGPSALGAPTDSTNGLITAADAGSFGQLRYLGTGDTTDRPFKWNLTAYHAGVSWSGDFQFVNAGTGLLRLLGQWIFPTNGVTNSEFIIYAQSAPIEFDGYINGSGNTNGTFTYLEFLSGSATNKITLLNPTNDFHDFLVTNSTLAFNNFADAGIPSAIGAGTRLQMGSGGGGWAGWPSPLSTGYGSTIQYFGPSATFTRGIQLNANVSQYYWAVDNAGTNTTLTLSNNITWNAMGASVGFDPRLLFFNASPTSTNAVWSQIPDANINVLGTPIGVTVAASSPVGYTINNGGVLQLLNSSNTFAGGVEAAYARTIQVTTLADIGVPSSIGTALSPYLIGTPAIQLTGINLGSTDSQRGGTLSYIGTTNASSNQRITILGSPTGTASGGIVRNDSPNGSSLHLTDTTPWNLYSVMPLCLVTLGGSAVATNTIDSIIPDSSAPSTGSLLVNGSAWRLTAAQTYSGTTMIAKATLILDGSIAAGLGLTVGANGLLTGIGTVNENVTVLAGGTVGAGDGAIGTLTINGNLTTSGNLYLKLNKQAGTNDQIVLGGNSLTLDGTLVVTNLAGNLAAGDQFTLFTAGSYSGAFATVSPATPGPNLGWDLSNITNGILKVVSVAGPNPPTISTLKLSGQNATLTGSNGVAFNPFHVISSTNVALPIAQWTSNGGFSFDGNGGFSITISNIAQPNVPVQFFRIAAP